MNDTSFAERLQERWTSARQEEADRSGAEQNQMHERSERLVVLEREGERVHRELIRPRAEDLARLLGATIEHFRTPSGFQTYVRCIHTPQFPATAKLGLGVEWDAGGLEAWLVCSVEVIPVLMALPGDARLPLEWEAPAIEVATRWIEERIMQFMDAYMRIGTDPYYQMDNLRTDPVCGMRVSIVEAPACAEHQGKRYAFCSSACEARFSANPELYAKGRVGLEV